MSSKSQSNREKQAAYKARRREAGFAQVALWVHEEDKERLREYARQLENARQKD